MVHSRSADEVPGLRFIIQLDGSVKRDCRRQLNGCTLEFINKNSRRSTNWPATWAAQKRKNRTSVARDKNFPRVGLLEFIYRLVYVWERQILAAVDSVLLFGEPFSSGSRFVGR